MVDTTQIHITHHAVSRFVERGRKKKMNDADAKTKIMNLLRHAKEVEPRPSYKLFGKQLNGKSRYFFSTQFVFVVNGNTLVTIMPMDDKRWRYKEL